MKSKRNYFTNKIKIVITDNETYPNKNLTIITNGSTLYGLASLSRMAEYSKQYPGDERKSFLGNEELTVIKQIYFISEHQCNT